MRELVFLAAPAKYSLSTHYIKAAAGTSPTLTFTATSGSPLADGMVTLTTKEGASASERFKIENNCITFERVRVNDSGWYTISFQDDNGEVEQATLELDVLFIFETEAGMYIYIYTVDLHVQ